MGIRIIGNGKLENNIAKSQKDYDNSIEKLSTGVRFTKEEPMPVERARSDALALKMRELNVYKQNANEGLNITQTAESALSSITNNVIRLKELAAQSTNSSLSDKERAFLFVEYQANYEDLVNTSSTANHSGKQLLNAEKSDVVGSIGKNSFSSNAIQIKISPPIMLGGKNVATVTIDELDKIKTMPSDLGIKSAKDLMNSEDGISIDDVLDNFGVSNEKELGASFDSAQIQLSGYRAKFGAANSRLSNAIDSINVAYENTVAANSRIKDVDYATEITKLAKANILVQASTSLLAQRNNNALQNVLTLVKILDKKS